MRRVRRVLIALALASAVAAAPASATPVPSAALQIAFTMPSGPGSVWLHAVGNCLLPSYGWARGASPRYVGATERPRGLLDVPGRSGEAIVPGEAIHVDRIFVPHPHALAAMDVGLQLAGRRAYLTGTIRPREAYSIRTAPRVRLAQLHGVTLATRSVRGVLVVTVAGRATMLRPLAGMFNRLRCRGPRIDEHPIPVGAPLGTVRATIVPARTSAAVARFGFGLSLSGTAYGPEPPSVVPTGGAQADGDGLAFAAAAGARLTLACTTSGCDPREGRAALQGGFDFVEGATRLSVTDVTLDVGANGYTIGGTAAGARVTIASQQFAGGSLEVGNALRAQLAATFGDPELGGFAVGVRLSLGPPALT